MVSRLDKLFELLESNNPSIRSAAATQIGKITTNSQVQIPSLLNKLLPYIKHKTWSVRIAAADAIKHIGINSKLWVPNIMNSTEKNIESFSEMISLEKLNLIEILKIGTRLYSTDIKELDDANVDTSVCENEITRHLGFIIPEELDIKDIVNNEDYEIFKTNENNKISIKQAVEKSLGNKLKKCAKRTHNKIPDSYEPNLKINRTKESDSFQNSDIASDWPWADFCTELLISLWNAKWEIRHGAATSLRELVRSQGSIMVCKGGNNLSKADYAAMHVRYQEEVVGRLLCTLALDQLSDFVSDEMVAPVRESCAQVLGVMSVHLSETLVLELARNLLSLLEYDEWTVNHGALLGLKYLLAARLDMLETLLPILYDPISSHLKDNCDDDVRCAAASAIMPIFNKPGTIALQPSQLESLRLDLWDVLVLRPDYTSPGSTCAVLHLLEKLYEHGNTADVIPHCVDDKLLDTLINRLHWCYYSYSESVRLTAVRTCRALLRFYDACQLDEIVGPATLQQIMSQLIQRVLVDDSVAVATDAEQLWEWLVDRCRCDLLAQSCFERLDVWMCATMQPARLCYSIAVILMPDSIESPSEEGKHQFPNEFYIGGRDSFLSDANSTAREDAVLRARLSACRLLAGLCRKLASIEPLVEHILITILTQIHLKERLAVQRFVGATILAYWHPKPEWILARSDLLDPLRQQLLVAIEEPIYYQELLPVFRQMMKACRDLLGCYSEQGVTIPGHPAIGSTTTLNLAQCQALVVPELVVRLDRVDDATVACAKTSVDMCSQQHVGLSRLVEISLGRALLCWRWLPGMLTPLIRPLMDAIRSEPRFSVQKEAAVALAQLVSDHMDTPRLSGPIGKLVKNLVQYLSDSIDQLSPTASLKIGDIVALHKTAQLGRDAFPGQEELPVAVSITESDNISSIKLRGSKLALTSICERLSMTENSQDLSLLLKVIYHHPMKLMVQAQHESSTIQSLVAALQTMVICLPNLKARHRQQGVCLISYAECVFHHCLNHNSPVIRHWSARVLAVLMMPAVADDSAVDLYRDIVDRILLANVLPALGSMSDENCCLGSIELVYMVMHRGPLQYRLGLVMNVLPVVLHCLSAPLDSVRRMATHVFSLLLTLLPLEEGGADLSLLTETRRQERHNNIDFLAGLLHPDSIAEYTGYEAHISASLRHYQKQGVNWLSFLNRYGLHGVLADDMGLGKTLQTIAIIVGEHCRSSNAIGGGGDLAQSCTPSLVVCPPTLTGHWHQEIARHVRVPGFSSVVYSGSVDTRLALLPSLGRYQVVITSYDILRNDIDRLMRPQGDLTDDCSGTGSGVTGQGPGLGPMAWNYLVLDEGHLIRNHKSKIAVATKSVVAKHRLVLTGTPIQNRVAELWSLFDFLMPGLLGSHPEFQKRFGRVLEHHQAYIGGGGNTSSTGAGTGKKATDSETATLALEQLHRQVLPFMLRRVKEDVLNELPPKLMQDYMCSMSPLQTRLYQYCVASRQHPGLDLLDHPDSADTTPATVEQRKHVFQALHYLRLVCNHPRLALCDTHPLYRAVRKELAAANSSLDDIAHSGKLVALKQLILDCGIGGGSSAEDSLSTASSGSAVTEHMFIGSSGVVSNHRLLVFCQSRSMIALVEQMIRLELPRASFLRLDGSVPIKERQTIVDKFNQDASIDMLLLTTSIGGLGLNLTSADVVIFVEHDWNPMRDLQAMDRAHRIGQKNTVNVYRLITADSIEEKIMSLQKFKLFIANTVVSADNKQLGSMNTEGLLDIMNKEAWTAGPSDPGSSASASSSAGAGAGASHRGGGGYKAVLASMQGVYESLDEYDDEYSLESFVQKL